MVSVKALFHYKYYRLDYVYSNMLLVSKNKTVFLKNAN